MRKSPPQPNGRGGGLRRTISFLTQDETKRLFAAIKTKRDRAIFLTAYRHGLRASEIGMLQRTDFTSKAALSLDEPETILLRDVWTTAAGEQGSIF